MHILKELLQKLQIAVTPMDKIIISELDMGLCTQVTITLILITVLYLDLKEKRIKWDTTKI